MADDELSRVMPSTRRALACLALIGVASLGPAPHASAAAGSTARVSLTSAGGQPSAESVNGSIAGTGRYVVFESFAADIVAGDTNASFDVFVRDRVAGTSERISVGQGGAQSNADSWLSVSTARAASDDGAVIVFASDASNLVSGDANDVLDVFVRDRAASTTTRISTGPGAIAWNDGSGEPTVSADGRYIAFETTATLVPGDTNDASDVMVYDRTAAVMSRASVRPDGTQAAGDSFQPAADSSGRVVAFYSDAAMVAADTNGTYDVYVRDLNTATTTLVSRSSGGIVGNAGSFDPSVSPDGRYIAYSSASSNLVTGDSNGVADIFLFDRQLLTTTRVSVSTSGAQGGGASFYPSLSTGAGIIAFSSLATDLVPGDTNTVEDVFVRDRAAGITRRVSIRASPAAEATSLSYAPTVTSDGALVAYESEAANLVAGDTNDSSDVFVSEPDTIASGAPTIASPVNGAWLNATTVEISGTTEPYASVEIREAGASLGQARAGGNGAWSITRSFGDGAHTITAVAFDLAGNESAAATRSFTIDRIAPPTPVIDTPGEGSVHLTSTLTVGGSAEPAATVSVREGASTLATLVAGPGGAWSTSLTFGEGTHVIVARARDQAGNLSTETARTFTIDALPPGAPAILAPAQGSSTNTRPTTVSGTGEPGATIRLYAGAGLVGTTNAGGTGSWSMSVAFTDGTHSVTATATDSQGRVGPASASRTFTVDTVPPGPTTITSPSNDALVPGTFTITGHADPSTTIRIYDAGSVARAVSSDASGNWQASVALSDGGHDLTARAIDEAGNLGPASGALHVVVDGTAPTVAFTTDDLAVISSVTTTQIEGTAGDANGVARVVVRFVDILGRDLGTIQATCAGCGTRSPSEVSWTVAVPDAVGPVTVTAQAFDLVSLGSARPEITVLRL